METDKKSVGLRLAVIIGAIIVLGLIIYFTKFNSKKEVEKKTISIAESGATFDGTAFTKDTDGDGLRDWEESLWGTDLNNPDTDGDGTPDGDEVAMGRDPLIPGPDDKLKPELTPVYKRTDTENLNTTESFQKDYYDGIAKLSADGDLTNDTLQTFISGLAREYVAKEQLKLRYSDKDITISSDPSIAVIKDYGNRLGVVAEIYAGIDFKKEIESIQAFLESGGDSGTETLDSIITQYTSARERLLNVGTVPYALSEAHLNILNGVTGIEEAMTAMKASYKTDPLKSMINLSLYQQGVLLISKGSNDVVDYMKERNIIFTSSEPGFILSNK